jgi:hypothetical protein
MFFPSCQVNPLLVSEGAANTAKMGVELIESALGKSILDVE